MYLSLWGKPKSEITLEDIYEDYRHRYDIEPHNRFSKQALLADKYQASSIHHLDAWFWVVQMTYWLLYTASKEVDICVNKWEQYLEEVKRAKESDAPKSVAMTRKGAKRLFLTFDLKLYAPRKSKNGIGRQKGDKQEKRKRYKPKKKAKRRAKKREKCPQIE